jgi:hypothetical protein
MTHKGTTLALALFAMLTAGLLMAQDRDDRDKAQPEKIINGPRIEQVTNDAATIAWSTNVGGSTVVKYGTDPRNLNEMAESPYADNDKGDPKYQTHRVHLHHLKPNTTYFYKVISGQGEGTGTESESRVEQFRTK